MKINIGKFLEIIIKISILLNFIKKLDLKKKKYNY